MKYLRVTTLDCKDIWMRISEFVAKIQFLWRIIDKKKRILWWKFAIVHSKTSFYSPWSINQFSKFLKTRNGQYSLLNGTRLKAQPKSKWIKNTMFYKYCSNQGTNARKCNCGRVYSICVHVETSSLWAEEKMHQCSFSIRGSPPLI